MQFCLCCEILHRIFGGSNGNVTGSDPFKFDDIDPSITQVPSKAPTSPTLKWKKHKPEGAFFGPKIELFDAVILKILKKLLEKVAFESFWASLHKMMMNYYDLEPAPPQQQPQHHHRRLCVPIPDDFAPSEKEGFSSVGSPEVGSYESISLRSVTAPVQITPGSSPETAPSSILRNALTKPLQAYSCPAPSLGQAQDDDDDVFDQVPRTPKYNLDAIKNYPPFRDVYNAVRARSKSVGTRHRSSSESGSSVKCSRCCQVLTSKCLVQRCSPPSEQTKCKDCGRELTTKCLLSNCMK